MSVQEAHVLVYMISGQQRSIEQNFISHEGQSMNMNVTCFCADFLFFLFLNLISSHSLYVHGLQKFLVQSSEPHIKTGGQSPFPSD
jgi:hypothetical protein